MVQFSSPAALSESVGTSFGPSSWITIDQARIQAFADATGDQQWIHTDPVRAAAGPFEGTIAHGYLTLSLLPVMTQEILQVDGVAAAINYGADRLRFVQPVPVDSRVRATGVITSVSQSAAGVRLGYTITVSIDGLEKPALVVDTLTLYVPAS
ncbi:MaoC family dehydratase [Frondihabitans australicus]|uniref:Acyl dehydratase n=1 Tax=Frondihabitans australicus TaxID=386892 RepID=A0A495IGC3_9MICO|nr:MaoC family dehydratase [Frondihabitans australicus]RKR74381.1 acyl dehydratase [Frondihabitans australicus]